MALAQETVELDTERPGERRAFAKLRALITIVAAAVVVVTVAWFLDVAGGDLDTARILLNLPRNPGAGPRIGQPAPDVTLSDLQGQSLTLSELRGRPVVINFFATWCVPCRIEMPLLQAAYEHHQTDGLIIIGLDTQESPMLVQEFVNLKRVTFPVVIDPTGQVTEGYRARAYPTSIFVDPDGTVTDVHRGVLSPRLLQHYLSKILPAS
ncbi:MAG: TlpA family protein disulfide reductase [Anaerolineae bacterium]